MIEPRGATLILVHQSGREMALDTDISPQELEEVIFSILAKRPECPIIPFKHSGKDHHMLINLNHYSYCEVNPKGERMTDSGILIPQIHTIPKLGKF